MNTDTQNFESPFLNNRERVLENEFGFVIYDGFPVSEGHCLIVPHRVYSDYFESTEDEVVGLQKLIIETKKLLDKKFQPKGYNVGINCGEVAGQTVPHVTVTPIWRTASAKGLPWPCRTSTWRSFSTMSSGFSRLPPIRSSSCNRDIYIPVGGPLSGG